MSQWIDPVRWAALCDGSACPICQQGAPSDVLLELEGGWLTAQERAPVHGYACLVFRRHVVELHDLSESEGVTFMRDMRIVSRALSLVTGAIKLNYEIHGNSIPHLHVHFFPRHVGDAFENQPINPKLVVGPVYAPGEYDGFRERLIQALTRAGA